MSFREFLDTSMNEAKERYAKISFFPEDWDNIKSAIQSLKKSAGLKAMADGEQIKVYLKNHIDDIQLANWMKLNKYHKSEVKDFLDVMDSIDDGYTTAEKEYGR